MLKRAADVAGVAVWKVGALDHEDVRDAAHGIDPGLRAPGATVAVAARCKHRGDAGVRCFQNAGADAPAVVCPALAVGVVLKKTGRQRGGRLWRGEEL